MEWEIDGRIGAASAVMEEQYWSVAMKIQEIQELQELSQKVKQLLYQSVNIGLELWAETERTRLWIQAVEMSFPRRLSGLSLRERVIQEVELLLLHVQVAQSSG